MKNIPGLTMRATVERNVGTDRDPYGSIIPAFADLHAGGGALLCVVQPMTEGIVTADGKYISVAGHRMIAPADADLKEDDLITRVQRLNGDTIFDSRFRITGLLRQIDHTHVMLEEYG